MFRDWPWVKFLPVTHGTRVRRAVVDTALFLGVDILPGWYTEWPEGRWGDHITAAVAPLPIVPVGFAAREEELP